MGSIPMTFRQLSMPKKRKRPGFRAAKAVRAIARERIGAPPPSHALKDKRYAEKHKKKLLEETDESS